MFEASLDYIVRFKLGFGYIVRYLNLFCFSVLKICFLMLMSTDIVMNDVSSRKPNVHHKVNLFAL